MEYNFNKSFSEKPNLILLAGITWRQDKNNNYIGLTISDNHNQKTTMSYLRKALDVRFRKNIPPKPYKPRAVKEKTDKEPKPSKMVVSCNGKRYYKLTPDEKKISNKKHYDKKNAELRERMFFRNIREMKISSPHLSNIKLYDLTPDLINRYRHEHLESCSDDYFERINNYYDKLIENIENTLNKKSKNSQDDEIL